MPAFIDITGRQFGRWTVISKSIFTKGDRQWSCRCQCGTIRDVSGRNLRNGLSNSCGCWNLEQIRSPKKHGMSKTRQFRNWCQMISRCNNPNNPRFERYGGRGIKVCHRWLASFSDFMQDMGPRPKGLTIERIDNDGDYEPGNCRWATNREQQRNKRSNRIIFGFGKSQLLVDWARDLHMSASLLHYHLKRGRTVEQIANA